MKLTTRDLIDRLRKTYTQAASLAVGDIIVSESVAGTFEVATIQKEANGFYSILDENDSGYPSTPPGQIFLIIDRSCFG